MSYAFSNIYAIYTHGTNVAMDFISECYGIRYTVNKNPRNSIIHVLVRWFCCLPMIKKKTPLRRKHNQKHKFPSKWILSIPTKLLISWRKENACHYYKRIDVEGRGTLIIWYDAYLIYGMYSTYLRRLLCYNAYPFINIEYYFMLECEYKEKSFAGIHYRVYHIKCSIINTKHVFMSVENH